MDRTLRLAEFAELAATAVAATGLAAASDRVRVVPGERMLRSYVTQGVLDRPTVVATPAGREARYGRRHLLQLVAAKRLQATGATMAEIRERLAGADGAALAALAALPEGVVPDGLGDTAPSAPSQRRADFWREPAAPAAATAAQASAATASPAGRPSAVPVHTVHVLRVAAGVELHLDARRWSASGAGELAAAVSAVLASHGTGPARHHPAHRRARSPITARPRGDAMTASPPVLDRSLVDLPEEPGRPGCGVARTEHGALPLVAMDVDARIVGLTAACTVRQTFRNTGTAPVEVTYVFPLPSRGAVTALRAVLGGRIVEGRILERGAARQVYEDALAAGQRAALAEKERPDVFTTTLGNLRPGEDAEVALELVSPLAVDDGEATFRFPLVVAPRYTAGTPLPGEQAGTGDDPDTDAVPDASRVTPPRLGDGDPRPDLSVRVTLDAAGLGLEDWRCSHDMVVDSDALTLAPGARLDRDLILRARLADAGPQAAMVTVADADGEEGTWAVTVVAPRDAARTADLDVVVLLDRSGSMRGWKMVAARRAAARLVDGLGSGDRFAVLGFDDRVEQPDATGLQPGTDRLRFAAVRWLSALDARGGTELGRAIEAGTQMLPRDPGGRRRCVVLVTDGQVSGEDQVLQTVAGLRDTTIHCVGIDKAVNAGLLERLARSTGGRVELVEGEDRLDEALDRICRLVNPPVLTDVTVDVDGLIPGTEIPEVRDALGGVPLVIAGRYRGQPPQTARLRANGGRLPAEVAAGAGSPALPVLWAQARIAELEDRYAAGHGAGLDDEIVRLSLRHHVLSRFTAFVAVDPERGETDDLVQVVQRVEEPAGWAGAPMLAAMASAPYAPAPAGSGPSHRSLRAMRLSRPELRRPAGRPKAPDLVAAVRELLDDLRVAAPDVARRARELAATLRVTPGRAELAALLELLADALDAGQQPDTDLLDRIEAASGGARRRFWER